MRSLLFNLSLLAVAAAPMAARAASLDQITLTDVTTPGTVYTFVVPATIPIPTQLGTNNAVGDYLGSFYLNNVPVTAPGTTPGQSDSPVYFFDAATGGGGLEDDTPSVAVVFAGESFFIQDPSNSTCSSDLACPVWVLGSGGTNYLTNENSNDLYSYDIAAYTPPPVPGAAPEPSSLLLLGTGALGVLGSFRRRLFA